MRVNMGRPGALSRVVLDRATWNRTMPCLGGALLSAEFGAF